MITAPPETVTVNAQIPQQPDLQPDNTTAQADTTVQDPSDSVTQPDTAQTTTTTPPPVQQATPAQDPNAPSGYAQGQSNPDPSPVLTSGAPDDDTAPPPPAAPKLPQTPGPPVPQGVSPNSPYLNSPGVQASGRVQTIMDALSGGPRFTYKIDTNGVMQKTQVARSNTTMGMAIALEAISGGLAGLAGKGPAAMGQAGVLGLQQGQKIAATTQEGDRQAQQEATADYARKAQIVQTNMQMLNNARQAGRENQEFNQKYIDSYKSLNDWITKTPGASLGVVNYKDFAKYNVTEHNAVPYKLMPRPDPNHPGEQVEINGVPQWDMMYRIINPSIKGPGALTKDQLDYGAKHGMKGLTASNGGPLNIPEDYESTLSQSVSAGARIGAMQQFEQNTQDQFDRINKGATTAGTPGSVFDLAGGDTNQLADFITKHEGGNPKDRNTRNNNDGNLVADASWKGAVDSENLPPGQAPFRVYPDKASGRQGLLDQIALEQKRNPDMTPEQFFAKYDPKGATQYAAEFRKTFNAGGTTEPAGTQYTPTDIAKFGRDNPGFDQAVTDFQPYMSNTGNLAEEIKTFGKANPAEAQLISLARGGTGAVDAYDVAKKADLADADDARKLKQAGALAAQKQVTDQAASAKMAENLNIPDKFVRAPNEMDMSSQELRANLKAQGVKIPSNFENLYQTAHYMASAGHYPGRVWLKGSPDEMDAQTGLSYIGQFINKGFDEGNYKSRVNFRQKLNDPTSKGAGASIQSASIAAGHVAQLSDLADAMDEANSHNNLKPLNALANKFNIAIGDTPANTYKAVATAVGNEVAKTVAGDKPTEDTVRDFLQSLDASSSRDQIDKVSRAVAGLMHERVLYLDEDSQGQLGEHLHNVGSHATQLFKKYGMETPWDVQTGSGGSGSDGSGGQTQQTQTQQPQQPPALLPGQRPDETVKMVNGHRWFISKADPTKGIPDPNDQ